MIFCGTLLFATKTQNKKLVHFFERYLGTMFKPSRAIRLLSLHGADALKSSWNSGRYYGPLVSKRIAKRVRKESILDGTFGKFIPEVGGWNPLWDTPKKMCMIRPAKGHLRERNRQERVDKIDNAMKGMPDRLKKYKQEAIDRRPKRDIFHLLSRIKLISKDNAVDYPTQDNRNTKGGKGKVIKKKK